MRGGTPTAATRGAAAYDLTRYLARRPRDADLCRWAFFSILPVAAWHLEEAEQPQALAQRIPIDPEQAGRLELIAAREIEGLP